MYSDHTHHDPVPSRDSYVGLLQWLQPLLLLLLLTLPTTTVTSYTIPLSSTAAKTHVLWRRTHGRRHHHPITRNDSIDPYLFRNTCPRRRRSIVVRSLSQSDNTNMDTIQNDTESSSSTSTTTTILPDHHNNNAGWIHGVTSKSGPLNEAVLTILHQDDRYRHYTLYDANDLIDIGAVWAQMETLTNEEILSGYEDDQENDARYVYADLPKGWGSGSESFEYDNNNNNNDIDGDDLDAYLQTMSQQRYRRILTPTVLPAGLDVRVYPQPRRFTEACEQLRSKTNLLYEDTTFIVVDKPPMLPTQPDASNYVECCPSCVNSQLGPFLDILGNQVTRPLLCHRIDTCVGGVVVLSKDRNGQRVFHQYQRQRQLRKMYFAVTTQPVPTGQHIHWMWAQQSSRRRSIKGPPCQLVRHTPPDSRRIARTYWNRCVLEVVNCVPIQIDPEKLQSMTQTDESPSPPSPQQQQQQQQQQPQYYQSTIRLVTGRKHQVRAQLASLNCPIINDTLYGPIAGYTFDDLEDAETDMERQILKCRVPTRPIGLQAAGILFGGIKVRANAPWWG